MAGHVDGYTDCDDGTDTDHSAHAHIVIVGLTPQILI